MDEATDHNILLELIKIKDYIEDHSLKRILRKYGNDILSSIFDSHKSFANALFKDVELQFIPLYITNIIGEELFDIEPKKYDHYVKYIKNNQAIFKAIHDKLREKQLQEQPNDQKYYEEQMKRILLDEASIERSRPLNLKSLVRTIYDRVFMFPYIGDISELHEFYLRNIQSKTVKLSIKRMPKVTLSNGQKEEVERLPWRSKMKANHYMDKLKFTDEQKEYARNYLLNDGFSLKKNLKYQLKAVAPRHTLIIDLQWPAKIVPDSAKIVPEFTFSAISSQFG